MNVADLSSDELYVLRVGYELLKRCDGAISKDGVGFNKPDAFLARHILYRNVDEVDREHLEFLRRFLLKYERQIVSFGLDYERLKRIRLADKARFLTKPLKDSKISKVQLKVDKKQFKMTIVTHSYKSRENSYEIVIGERSEGLALIGRVMNLSLGDAEGVEEAKVELTKDDAVIFLKSLMVA